MTQFAHLVNVVDKMKKKMAGEDTDSDGGSPEVVLSDPEMSPEEKYEAVLAALPLSSNEGFLNVLQDKDGPNCLMWILQLTLNKAVVEEGATYDTTSASSVLASKIIHTLFSIEYVKQFKVFDPRENYTQQEGTAMERDIYMWMMSAMEAITAEFYSNFGMENKFKWSEFFPKFRNVWTWTRSNNSDNRRARRRRKKN